MIYRFKCRGASILLYRDVTLGNIRRTDKSASPELMVNEPPQSSFEESVPNKCPSALETYSKTTICYEPAI